MSNPNPASSEGIQDQGEENRNFDKKLVAHQEKILNLQKDFDKIETKIDSKINIFDSRLSSLEKFKGMAIGIAITSGIFLQIIIKAFLKEW